MRLACSTAAFPFDRLHLALVKAEWAGFRAVEIDLPGELPIPEEQLREHLRANDLEVAALHAGELAPDLDALGRIGRAARLARALDAPTVLLRPPAGLAPADLAGALRLLDAALGGLEARLCLVNRAGSSLAAPEQFRALWREALPERAGLAIDPLEAAAAGWDAAGLDELPALPSYAYLPYAPARPEPGAFVDSLRRHGYDGVLCVRLVDPEPWAVEPTLREAREWAEALVAA